MDSFFDVRFQERKLGRQPSPRKIVSTITIQGVDHVRHSIDNFEELRIGYFVASRVRAHVRKPFDHICVWRSQGYTAALTPVCCTQRLRPYIVPAAHRQALLAFSARLTRTRILQATTAALGQVVGRGLCGWLKPQNPFCREPLCCLPYLFFERAVT